VFEIERVLVVGTVERTRRYATENDTFDQLSQQKKVVNVGRETSSCNTYHFDFGSATVVPCISFLQSFDVRQLNGWAYMIWTFRINSDMDFKTTFASLAHMMQNLSGFLTKRSLMKTPCSRCFAWENILACTLPYMSTTLISAVNSSLYISPARLPRHPQSRHCPCIIRLPSKSCLLLWNQMADW